MLSSLDRFRLLAFWRFHFSPATHRQRQLYFIIFLFVDLFNFIKSRPTCNWNATKRCDGARAPGELIFSHSRVRVVDSPTHFPVKKFQLARKNARVENKLASEWNN